MNVLRHLRACRSALSACVLCFGIAASSAQQPTSATALASAPELTLERLPASVNSPDYDEISPVVSRDGKRLYFTRSGSPDYNQNLFYNGTDARDSLGDAEYNKLLGRVYSQIGDRGGAEAYTSRFNQDVWLAEMSNDGSVQRVTHPDTPLNNALPNALAATLPEPGHYVTINQFPRRGGMTKGFSHTYVGIDGSWTWPDPITIDGYHTNGEGVGLTLSGDGDIMILSLDRSGGRGATDLYISRRVDSMTWSRPVNLGAGINTSFRESTPSLSEDKRTLYFSSNRQGRGGNDIYFCRRLDSTWNSWSPARRFKPPISSTRDDSQPYFNEATGYLYFTSNRDGSSDIYRVRVQPPREVNVLVVGTVKNARTGEVIDADQVQILGRGYGGIDTVLNTLRGKFDIRLDEYADLKIIASKAGFLDGIQRVEVRRADDLNSYAFDVFLDPQVAGGTITLAPIYFEQSKAVILPESTNELRRLRDVLASNDKVYVRIEGHTDDRGPESALDKLSTERAESIRNFLIAGGISPIRVQATGRGARNPVVGNDTVEGRAANRRVEVVITRILGGGNKPAVKGSQSGK